MTGVIYARYSSDNQREESIEGQLRECKVFAEKNGIQIIDTYIDRAMSAKTDNRPDFQKMIKDSAKQQFETVIVWKLDRFARNRYDSAHYKSILKRNNVRVLSATEVISQGAEGIILESVLEGMAEYYSAELAEKVIRGQTENALSCRFNGGTVPVGYSIVNQRFVVNNDTAPLVLSAYEMYDEGKTMQEVADDLNVKGLRNTRGTKLTINTVSNLLTNRRYIGEYSYRDILVPDGIPAIVPKDLFNRVQERIAKNKKSPARHRADEEYILSTKLYCGKCMTFMVGESGTARNKETYWKNEENSVKLIQRLKGHKHLIRGNHDRVHGRLRFYYESIEHYAEINDNDRLVILCHYPIPFYKNQHYGAVMLYGHVHNTREQDFIEKWKRELWESEIPCNMINVGCMMEYMKYTPRTLNEILAANPAPEFRKNTQQKRDDSK